jgi:hypothetical protein
LDMRPVPLERLSP